MSDLRIYELRLGGFKGRSLTLPLSGRDLITAGNMIGKTSLVQALDFLSNGSISGVKREGLISFCTNDSFFVEIGFGDEPGRPMKSVRRTFKVTKTGGTKMVLKFDPEGLEETLKEAEERLVEEFKDAPLVTFDLRDFLNGDDSNRLETCMGFAPSSSGGAAEVGEVIASVKVEGEKDPVEKIREELLGFSGPLPADALERFQALSTLLEKWAKSERADVAQKTKSIRQLSDITREAGVKTGSNVEALEAQKAEAETSLKDLEAAQAKADERRELIKEERETFAKLQREALEALGAIDDANKAVETAEDAAAVSSKARDVQEQEEAAWGEKDAQRIVKAKEVLATKLQELEDSRIEKRAAQDAHGDAVTALDDGRAALRRLERMSDLTAQALTALELDDFAGHCPVCSKKLGDQARKGLVEQMRAEEAKDDPAALQRDAVETLRGALAIAVLKRDATVEAEEQARQDFEAAQTETHPKPFDGAALNRAVKAIGRDEAYLERVHGLLKAAEVGAEAKSKAAADSKARIGDLSVNLPEDMVAGAIEGAKMEVERVEVQIRTVEANRHRFEDQEKLRRECTEAEARLEALKAWRATVGLKGITGEWLSKTLGSVLEPARSLVRDVIPGGELGLSWETPRGKPGLRIELRRGEKVSAYDSMSGAERAVVGTALILAFSGVDNPPAMLATECEVMDDATEAAYLTALANFAGPSGLMVTTHHGKTKIEEFLESLDEGDSLRPLVEAAIGDHANEPFLGIYKRTNLADLVTA